jgi:sulfur carrier protein ThiS
LRRNLVAHKPDEGDMMVTVNYRDRTWEIKPGSTVRHIVEKAGLNPESILAVRDGKLINDATLTEDGDIIKLVSVVSGG